MIDPNGWLDWAEIRPAPPSKVNPGINDATLYIPHSAVGYWPGYVSRIYGTDRASVHGWIAYDGKVIQSYPLTARCWASGSTFPNNNGIAFENEGGHRPENEPLTEPQIAANVRIIQDIGNWKGRSVEYWRRPNGIKDTDATLYEHRECVRFGSEPTACPSDRIPWDEILRRLQPTQELRGTDMRIIHDHTGAAYLAYEAQLAWIPNAAIYEDLKTLVYGNAPHQVSIETWAWLQAGIDKDTGLPTDPSQGARFVRIF